MTRTPSPRAAWRWIALLLAGGLAQGAQAGQVSAMSSPKAMYVLRCSGCHNADGQGAASAGVPPFQGSIGRLAADAEGRRYIMSVPGIAGSGLNPHQKAEVLNYVLDRWGERPQQAARFTAKEVERLTAQRPSDIVTFRRRIATRMQKQGIGLAEYPWP